MGKVARIKGDMDDVDALLEILNALTKPAADFRKLSCAKNNNNDYQDNNEFRHAESEHEVTSRF